MKVIFRSWLVVLTLLVSSVSQAALISVDGTPGGAIDNTVGVTVGDSFAVDVLIQDVNDFAGFQFLFGFDPAILAATTVTSGDIFGLDTFLIDDTIGANSVSFSESTFAAIGLDIVGPSLLATISFNAIASGVNALSLSDVIFSDSGFNSILPITINGAVTTVSAPPVSVPEPASLFLLLAGLSLLVAMRRHNHSF